MFGKSGLIIYNVGEKVDRMVVWLPKQKPSLNDGIFVWYFEVLFLSSYKAIH